MKVIINAKITDEAGHVLFDIRDRVEETTQTVSMLGNDIVETEDLRLAFKWIKPFVDEGGLEKEVF